jgi:hypothetical protein
MTDDPRTLDDLRKEASDLQIDGRSSMDRDQLIAAIDTARAAAGVQDADTFVASGDAPAAPPVAPDPIDLADPDPAPASPDAPTDGRPPLVQIAEEQAANTYVRVIGGAEEDE